MTTTIYNDQNQYISRSTQGKHNITICWYYIMIRSKTGNGYISRAKQKKRSMTICGYYIMIRSKSTKTQVLSTKMSKWNPVLNKNKFAHRIYNHKITNLYTAAWPHYTQKQIKVLTESWNESSIKQKWKLICKWNKVFGENKDVKYALLYALSSAINSASCSHAEDVRI